MTEYNDFIGKCRHCVLLSSAFYHKQYFIYDSTKATVTNSIDSYQFMGYETDARHVFFFDDKGLSDNFDILS